MMSNLTLVLQLVEISHEPLCHQVQVEQTSSHAELQPTDINIPCNACADLSIRIRAECKADCMV